ncbi:PH domain-containing protein [Corynebacterium comes]|uniref:Bacterial membrane flanked domain protein n=1 Tax=Corynebacterium comes TaxID=2675218 RepID=A0A6B8W2M2_9CORY|nr:PH domain-containing protein [Corynebacterium comes]QGU03890.1 Bacterial membrane flanked domain protein [Corynebacterium comes]
MGLFQPGQGEVVRADLTSPLRVLTFPVLELILVTGLSWMLIGWLDQPGMAVDPQLRNTIVLIWAVLALWRFVLPLFKARRRRFVVTDRRIVVRAGALRARTDSIPFRDIRSVKRRRSGITLAITGYDRPLYFPDVPRAKKVTAMIESSLPPAQMNYW